MHGISDSVDRQVGDLPYAREQREADLLLLLLLLLLLCTESETPWTGRSETCPTTCQNEVAVLFAYFLLAARGWME